MLKNLEVNNFTKEDIKKRKIHDLVSFLKKNLGFNIFSVTVNFISPEDITAINIEHLDHHRSTDIITFNYTGNLKDLDGEIFISLDDARNNADYFKVSYTEELYRLVIHGFLHMTGFEDKRPKDRKKMFGLQEKMLTEYLELKNI